MKQQKEKRIILKKKQRLAISAELGITEQTVFQSLAYKTPKSEIAPAVRRLALEKHNGIVQITSFRPMTEDDV